MIELKVVDKKNYFRTSWNVTSSPLCNLSNS